MMLVLDFSRCAHTTQIIAILALALVAGFSVNPSISCPDAVPLFGLNISYSIKYPFTTISNSSVPFSGGDVTTGSVSQTDKGITQGAQFFVAWGSLSLIYAIVALIVYIFVTANEKLEKAVDFLVWTDVIFHIVWVINWFIASITWAVVFNHLKNNTNGLLNMIQEDLCPDGANTIFRDTYVQAAIATVFGFLSVFVWFVNIFWVVIDTKFYTDWKAQRGGSSSL